MKIEDAIKNHSRLSWLAQKHKMTSREIAGLCGVSMSTVSGWRCANMHKPISSAHLAKVEAHCLPLAAA